MQKKLRYSPKLWRDHPSIFWLFWQRAWCDAGGEQNKIVALFGARRPAFRYQLLHYYFQKLHDISTFPHQSQTYAQIKFKGNPFFSRSMIEWLSFKLTVRFKSFNMCYRNEFETRSSQGRLKWRWIRRSSGFGQDIYWDVSLWLYCKIG